MDLLLKAVFKFPRYFIIRVTGIIFIKIIKKFIAITNSDKIFDYCMIKFSCNQANGGESMVSDSSIKGECRVSMLPVIQISTNKFQPRKKFDTYQLRALAGSIEQNGILQPLTVRRLSPINYELISGERRLRAAVLAGMNYVPCIVIHCSECQSAVYTLIENLQREDLTFFEEAEAIKLLIDEYSFTQENIANQIGKSQSTVANKIRLLRLTPEERELITKNDLTERHARTLIKIEDAKLRKKVLTKVVENGLNVGQTEQIVNKVISPELAKKAVCPQTIIIKDVRLFFNTVNKALETMRKSGIDATQEKTETEKFIEYRIRIPK